MCFLVSGLMDSLARPESVDDCGWRARQPSREVLGLHVPVGEALGVHVLHAPDQLDCDPEHHFERQLLVARVEQVLQARPEQLQLRGVVVLPSQAEVVDLAHALCGAELSLEAVLQVQLRRLGLDGLQLDIVKYSFV